MNPVREILRTSRSVASRPFVVACGAKSQAGREGTAQQGKRGAIAVDSRPLRRRGVHGPLDAIRHDPAAESRRAHFPGRPARRRAVRPTRRAAMPGSASESAGFSIRVSRIQRALADGLGLPAPRTPSATPRTGSGHSQPLTEQAQSGARGVRRASPPARMALRRRPRRRVGPGTAPQGCQGRGSLKPSRGRWAADFGSVRAQLRPSRPAPRNPQIQTQTCRRQHPAAAF